MAESFGATHCVLEFKDGARLEVLDRAATPSIAAAIGRRESHVERWQRRWPMAALSLLLMALTIGVMLRWGIPALGEKVVPMIPDAADRMIGERILQQAHGRMLHPSRLSEQRIAEVEAVFHSVLPARPRIPMRMLVRDMRDSPPNAMALPNGTIVMTDAMVLKILDGGDELDGHMQAELAGIFAHEIGHVEHRHSMRAMARYSLTAIASMALFSDFSSVLAGAPALLLHLNFSRDLEREADIYAVGRLREAGISSLPLADLFEQLTTAGKDAEGGKGKPAWAPTDGDYFDSHPATAERIARFRGQLKPAEDR
jgi:predicted Zn-dependent protease